MLWVPLYSCLLRKCLLGKVEHFWLFWQPGKDCPANKTRKEMFSFCVCVYVCVKHFIVTFDLFRLLTVHVCILTQIPSCSSRENKNSMVLLWRSVPCSEALWHVGCREIPVTSARIGSTPWPAEPQLLEVSCAQKVPDFPLLFLIFQTLVKHLDFLMPTSQLTQRAASVFWENLYLQLTFSLPLQCFESSVAQNRREQNSFSRYSENTCEPLSLCDLCLELQWQGRVSPLRKLSGTCNVPLSGGELCEAEIPLLCCAHFANPPLWERGTSDGVELWRERFQGYRWRRVVRDDKQVILIHPPTTGKVTLKTLKTTFPKYKRLSLQNVK